MTTPELYFLAGCLFSLVLVGVGFFIGMKMMALKLPEYEELVTTKERKALEKIRIESRGGPLKMPTPRQIAEKKVEPIRKRIEYLIGDTSEDL